MQRGPAAVIIRSLEHDVAQAAVLGLKVVNKRTCLTSRFFYFLRSAFQIFSAQTTNAPNSYCA
ncbi:hypothetical protein D3G93_04865 [Escherichia coli]|nr:hypothetical protein [Escherichia coli]EFN9777774.1 hypothetical protein [Escherichia coli]